MNHQLTDAEEAAAIRAAVERRTMVDALAAAVARAGDRPALTWPDCDGVTVTRTWAQVGAEVTELAAGLLALGLQPRQTVALMAPNCGEHVLVDQAAVHAGGLPFSIYPTAAPEQIAHLVAHSRAAFAVLHGAEQLPSWAGVLSRSSAIQRVVVLDPAACPADSRFVSYPELRALGRAHLAGRPRCVAQRAATLAPQDPVALIYTSGTTGAPKGVLLTHSNVLYKAEAWRRSTGIGEHPVSISYLPYAHVAERVNGLYVPFHLAGHVHFCPSLERFPDLLAAVRPHSLTAVPRIWEKLMARLSPAGAGVEPAALRRAVGLDRAVAVASTAAPASGRVAEFFGRLGLRISSVYGMTETTGGITANLPAAYRSGTVGQIVAGCEYRIAPDGELLVRGPLLTPGYLDDPVATAELLDPEGWAHTGDLATEQDGYLSIVGRKKDLLVTAGGENIAPNLIEGLLASHPVVAQAMACGDGRRYVTALIVPELTPGEDVEALVAAAVADTNRQLARVQQIKDWRLVERPWTVETGELTPTLKLKRHIVAARHATLIEQMYLAVAG